MVSPSEFHARTGFSFYVFSGRNATKTKTN
uniref:Uncharacterized protein n=1 Tax=Siphoviridae sp. ctmpG14 TaxID=2825654 RepID=A0A8S5PDC7_9CAUD|nr:MAG TPA: hypothetical protein [Siphoviridae sp. ctmpG14]